MGHHPSVKHYLDLDLIPVIQKPQSIPQLELVIVLLNLWLELNLLEVDDLMILLGCVGAFALLILVLPKIHQPTNRWPRLW